MIKPITKAELIKADHTFTKVEKRARDVFKVLVDCNLVVIIGNYGALYGKKLKYSQIKHILYVEALTPRTNKNIKRYEVGISSYNDYFIIKGQKELEAIYTVPWKYIEMDSKKFIDMCKKKGFIKTLKM